MSSSYHHDKKNNRIHFDSSAFSDPSISSEISVSSTLENVNTLSVPSESCEECGPCDLCHTIKADPTNMSKHGGRLLTVKIKVNNVCYDKKVSIACIIYGKYDKILAFKAFTTILCRENGNSKCGTIERTLTFVIPDDDIFDPCNLNVRVIANYIYPCE